MPKIKRAQIVRFHTPNADEDYNQLYVVLETIEDGKRSRAKMKALNTALHFKPIYTILIKDLKKI